MIRKFATVPGFSVVLVLILMTILAGAPSVHAQQTQAQPTPAQQPPAQPPSAQQQPDQKPSSIQETSPDEIGPVRKPKVKDYKNWTFNVGGGASLTNGTTANFVRGGGPIGAAGVARNYSKYFGFRLDFQFDNLPLRNSALELAQAPGATSHVYSFMLDPIINIPVNKVWGGYILAGPSFFHRSGKLDSSTALPGSACNPFFLWWGQCLNGSLPVSGKFLKANENQFGANFGGGITRKIRPNMEFYAEFRYLHGKHYNITTDLRPITIGVRW
jgi:Outer membrane protein beta-barrel domain